MPIRLVNDASTDNRTASNLVNLLLPEVSQPLSCSKSQSHKGNLIVGNFDSGHT